MQSWKYNGGSASWTRLLILAGLVVLVILISTDVSWAQCPMCRMSAESNLKNGGEAGRGLNNGILYMLATPYLIIGGIAYMWWRNRKQEQGALVEEAGE